MITPKEIQKHLSKLDFIEVSKYATDIPDDDVQRFVKSGLCLLRIKEIAGTDYMQLITEQGMTKKQSKLLMSIGRNSLKTSMLKRIFK